MELRNFPFEYRGDLQSRDMAPHEVLYETIFPMMDQFGWRKLYRMGLPQVIDKLTSGSPQGKRGELLEFVANQPPFLFKDKNGVIPELDDKAGEVLLYGFSPDELFSFIKKQKLPDDGRVSLDEVSPLIRTVHTLRMVLVNGRLDEVSGKRNSQFRDSYRAISADPSSLLDSINRHFGRNSVLDEEIGKINISLTREVQNVSDVHLAAALASGITNSNQIISELARRMAFIDNNPTLKSIIFHTPVSLAYGGFWNALVTHVSGEFQKTDYNNLSKIIDLISMRICGAVIEPFDPEVLGNICRGTEVMIMESDRPQKIISREIALEMVSNLLDLYLVTNKPVGNKLPKGRETVFLRQKMLSLVARIGILTYPEIFLEKRFSNLDSDLPESYRFCSGILVYERNEQKPKDPYSGIIPEYTAMVMIRNLLRNDRSAALVAQKTASKPV